MNLASTTYSIAMIPGDGIGRDVTVAARRVLDAAVDVFDGPQLDWHDYDWGCERYARHGAMMPDDGLATLARHDAILLGAVGFPGVADHVSLWGLLIPIRRHFEQWVNLRPVRLLDGLASPLAANSATLDVVIVRENSEGEYSQVGGRFVAGGEEFAVQQAVFSRRACERIIRYAFVQAQSRRSRVTGATKSNGIIHTMTFWDEIFTEVAADYPEVAAELMHVDALAAKMVLDPGSLDVIVASNLFGDILSDLGAALAGALGVAPSANLNPGSSGPAMFEPVHGSAPDIAGKGIANPAGAIWSAAMMVDHLGWPDGARSMMAALEEVTGRREQCTPDLGGTASTEQMTAAVVEAIEEQLMIQREGP